MRNNLFLGRRRTARFGVRPQNAILAACLFSLAALHAQPLQQVLPNPDCQQFFTFTATGQSSGVIDNRQQGCTTWEMVYTNSGFSPVSVLLQSAANNGGVPGSYGSGFPVQQTVLSGSNPGASTTAGFVWIQGLNAFVRAHLTATGSGIVQGAIFGWRIPNAGSSGGGGGITCLTQDVLAGTGSGCTSATVVGLETVPFCSGYTPTNGQFVQYTTGSSPNPCYTAATAGGGSTSSSGLTVYSQAVTTSMSSDTVYFPVGGGGQPNATEANANSFQGSAGTISGFGVNAGVHAIGSGTAVTFTWRKNGISQGVTCTVTDPAITCSDTTHSFSFSAGDALDIQATSNGAVAMSILWVLTAGSATAGTGIGSLGNGVAIYSGVAGISLSGTIYFPIGGGADASALPGTVNALMETGGTLKNFGASISIATGNTTSVVLTVYQNFATTPITCTITNPATTCSDTTHSITFAAGDTICVQAVFTGSIIVTPTFVFTSQVGATGASGSFVLIEEHTAAASAALQFTSCISSTYDTYQVEVVSLVPASDGAGIYLQFSTNGGSSYDSGSNYAWTALEGISNGTGSAGSNPDTQIKLVTAQSDSANQGLVGRFNIYAPGASAYKLLTGNFANYVGSSDGRLFNWNVSGQYLATTAVNAFQVIASTGNLTSGTLRCYGLAK
jgi:hypothetical protein